MSEGGTQPALPARVRVSHLQTTPSPAVLAQLQRIGPERAHLLEGLILPAENRVLFLAVAGGGTVAWMLGLLEEPTRRWHLEMAVTPQWRRRGIGPAFLEAFGRATGTDPQTLEEFQSLKQL
ncbi:GNAT superfamily N-acetyltransferase [Deinobacterium chartae]|uniref:GNAT superfamily N-acetyltransferase n=1 Tax=Deinobacterium chartae TaxID=521158 RepID=A0A841I3Z7_9DEIO|nr:GNAT family N-acetyltransferase [Deinobacterium chartae]MBB6099140.1 GNAT superfamily N-acetyltransferase [Deinobacterium chartae]